MLSFFRRLLNSRTGITIALLFIGLIGVAFALGDATGLSSRAFRGQSGTTAITVGSQTLSTTDLTNAANVELNKLKNNQQYAELTMPDFIAQGGLDMVIERQTTMIAMTQFAQSQGIRIGRSLIDNEISTQIPQIRGLDGKVDTKRYQEMLTALRLTDPQLHDQFAGVLLTQMLLGPVSGPAMAGIKGPAGMATPYASMMLEKRTGTIAFIDTNKMPAGAPVTDAEAQTYYKANIGRYTIPERRSVRYIALSVDDMRKRAAPTDAELAAAYKAQAPRFAEREQRTLKQVVMGDEKSATALAAKVRAGTPIDVAAKAAGLEAGVVDKADKAVYAAQSSQPLADQVFAAPVGTVVGPVKTPLGWVVVHVEKIDKLPAKTLDQAKPDLIKEVTDQKLAPLFQSINDQIQDAIAKRATFEQIAKMLNLPILTAPPAGPDGKDPTAVKPADADPKLAGLYQLAFGTTPDDDPQIAPMGQDGSAALAKLDQVIPATARPYAEVADQVKKDIVIERQVKAARDVANGVLAKVNKGMPLAQALKETGIALDGTKPFDGTRAQVNDATKPPTSQLILLFKTALHAARLLEAPKRGGWFVIVVDTVTRGDASKDTAGIDAQRNNLAQKAPNEYAEQFVRAVRDSVGVKRNEQAIAEVRAQLLGKGSSDDQAQ